MHPGLTFILVMLLAALLVIAVGCYLTYRRQREEAQARHNYMQARAQGYYCYGCGPTYAQLFPCSYHNGTAVVSGPFCFECLTRFHFTPLGQMQGGSPDLSAPVLPQAFVAQYSSQRLTH